MEDAWLASCLRRAFRGRFGVRGDKLHKLVRTYAGRFHYEIAPGVPNAWGAQCVNLSNLWLTSLRRPAHPGNAGWLMDAVRAGVYPRLRWAENTPMGVPPRGSLVVWSYSQELPEGHVDVFLWGDAVEFVGFDQNWPEGSPCHQQEHDYAGVAGWIVLEGLRLR